MNLWVLATVAVLLLAYGAVSARLQSTPVTQAMVFVAVGLLLSDHVLRLVEITVAQAEEGAGHVEPVKVILEEIGFGTIGGLVAGALGAWVLRTFADKRWMEGTWRQINAVATALLAYSLASALGGSGFIAAFVA